MDMETVISTNVAAAGYDPATRTMRVAFQSGGLYDYYNVEPALFEQMLLPHPWRRIGFRVKRHRFNRLVT